jgi:hypothetical protein
MLGSGMHPSGGEKYMTLPTEFVCELVAGASYTSHLPKDAASPCTREYFSSSRGWFRQTSETHHTDMFVFFANCSGAPLDRFLKKPFQHPPTPTGSSTMRVEVGSPYATPLLTKQFSCVITQGDSRLMENYGSPLPSETDACRKDVCM